MLDPVSVGGGRQLCMLRFQIAGAAGGYLLEHLLIESIGALRGGGIFAWANTGGAVSLLGDETFEEFLKVGDFRLFVGTDSITDPPAVQKLLTFTAEYPRLTVHAFLSPSASLFHPKLAWFEHPDHLSLIVGSGNLTMGGLRSNWEAFVVERMMGDAAIEAANEIEMFLNAQAAHLAPISDPRVMQKVQGNTGNERSLRTPSKSSPIPANEIGTSVEEGLITDFTMATGRASQANFKRKDYEGFFGAQVGTQRRISLRQVDANGSVGEIESRPSVQAKSHNWRFELDGLKAAVAAGGRPIGLFLRLASGEFVYTVAQPGTPGYSALDALLAARSSEPAGQMRRILITANELSQAWPAAPILSAQLPAL